MPADCRALIEELKGCSQAEFLAKLRGIETWTYGGTKGGRVVGWLDEWCGCGTNGWLLW